MQLRVLLKLNAKRALRKNWSRAMAIALLLTGISLLFLLLEALFMIVFSLTPVIDELATPSVFLDDVPNSSPLAMAVMLSVALLGCFASLPLQLGAVGWFLKVGRGESGEISDVFVFFSSWHRMLKSVWLYCTLALRTAFWTALFLLPAASVMVFSRLFSERALSRTDELLAAGGMTAGVILGFASFLFAMIWCAKYFCAPYLILLDPSLAVGRAIGQSAQLTRGHRGELFQMQVSLLGWRMLGMLIFPRVFTTGFVLTVEGLYASYLMQLGQQGQPVPADIPQADAASPEVSQ